MVPRGAGTVIPHNKIALGGGTRNSTVHNQVSNVTVNAPRAALSEANQDLAEKVGRAVNNSMKAMIAGEIHQQIRNGGIPLTRSS